MGKIKEVHLVKLDLPKARKRDYTIGTGYSFKVSKKMQHEVEEELKQKGWKRTGVKLYAKSSETGMEKNGVFIVLGDSGKFPYFCGDTTIFIDRKIIGDKPYEGPPVVEPARKDV